MGASMLLMAIAARYSQISSDHWDAPKIIIVVGICLFAVAYSPGEGPVPFTYSAEW
jgi:hypothetical protein